MTFATVTYKGRFFVHLLTLFNVWEQCEVNYQPCFSLRERKIFPNPSLCHILLLSSSYEKTQKAAALNSS
jgi:hypothetical protein